MVDARWYMILKELEYVSKIDHEADFQQEESTDARRLSRMQRAGLVLAASMVAAVLIAILPAV